MFTGLIQALGHLSLAAPDRLQVNCTSALILTDLAIGDSVAVDGVCLTVEKVLTQGFIVAASPETLSRTTLGQQASSRASVNLEASLRVGSKLGGHFVSGHVDGMGCLQAVEQTSESWEMSFTVPLTIGRYIVSKGSIAANGVSLTVADCNLEGTWFKAAVIPHSFATTNLHNLQPGSLVNLEADLLGKYAEKFLRLPGSALAWDSSSPAVTPEFLTEHGFY